MGDPPGRIRPRVKVLALDYGSARTGVAVSDPTGTIARPLPIVERAASKPGLDRIRELIHRERVECVVVGLPITLRGEFGAQARETEQFVEALRAATDVPVETFDERFTTKTARQRTTAKAPEDSVAAGELLTLYLTWRENRRT